MKLTIEAGQAEKLAGLFALAEDPKAERPQEELQGVWIQAEEHEITAMATNGHVLGSLILAGKSEGSGDVLIPNDHPLMSPAQWQAAVKKLFVGEVEIEIGTSAGLGTNRVTLKGETHFSISPTLQYTDLLDLKRPDWRSAIPNTNGDRPRRGVCLNPAYLASYFLARYGKNGDKHMLLDASGEETVGMRWYDLTDDSMLGVIMPLQYSLEGTPDHPYNRAKAQ